MAADLLPICLSLTDGDRYTVWAPRWRDAGDEWEAFLGKDEDLFVFETPADLVAFVRTNTDNDLVDHPAWKGLTEANAHKLEPADDKTPIDSTKTISWQRCNAGNSTELPRNPSSIMQLARRDEVTSMAAGVTLWERFRRSLGWFVWHAYRGDNPGILIGAIGGVVNLLTGHHAELGPVLASHMDVNAIDLCGADGDGPELERLAADNVKRVVHGRADVQSPWEIASFLELKTVWHPMGQ